MSWPAKDEQPDMDLSPSKVGVSVDDDENTTTASVSGSSGSGKADNIKQCLLLIDQDAKGIVSNAKPSASLPNASGFSRARLTQRVANWFPPTPRSICLFSVVFGWVVSGMLVLCLVEGMHGLTAIYVLVQMVSTIGYGDVTVQSKDFTKMFLSFHVLFCCIVAGSVIISTCGQIMQAGSESIGTHMRSMSSDAPEEEETAPETPMEKLKIAVKSPMGSAFLIFLVALLAGTLFFSLVENCTCSYAESKVDNCDPDNCQATGGYVKSVLDAWYMSCISLTTVGFGDMSPKTISGRLFAIVWCTVGVAAVGNCACQFSATFLEASKVVSRLECDIEVVFDQIDKSGNGVLDPHEFLSFALIEFGLCTMDDIDAITAQFKEMDQDGSGEVSREEVSSKYNKKRKKDTCRVERSSLLGVAAVIAPVAAHHGGSSIGVGTIMPGHASRGRGVNTNPQAGSRGKIKAEQRAKAAAQFLPPVDEVKVSDEKTSRRSSPEAVDLELSEEKKAPRPSPKTSEMNAVDEQKSLDEQKSPCSSPKVRPKEAPKAKEKAATGSVGMSNSLSTTPKEKGKPRAKAKTKDSRDSKGPK